ncbi:hypothetical protein ABW20_dc0100814 [Dactylellina cionopaga]|nr:hypothetical protein ABW20_dc0100814 [Dactylellina cionopaga]
MPPKKKNNKKRNSVIAVPKENGDADPLTSSVPQTPAEERDQEIFVTPADRPENPMDAPTLNGAASSPVEEKIKDTDATAKTEGDEAAAAWGLDDEKSKILTEEPDFLPDTADRLENGDIPEETKHSAPVAEIAEVEEKPAESAADDVVPPVVTAEETSTTELPAPVEATEEVSETKLEEPAPVEEEKPEPAPADLDVPDTADAKDPIIEDPVTENHVVEEPIAEAQPVEEPVEETLAVEEPVVAEAAVEESVVEPVVTEANAEEPVVAEADAEEPAVVEPTVEEPIADEAQADEAAIEKSMEEPPAEIAEPVEAEPEPKAEEPEAKEQIEVGEAEVAAPEAEAEAEAVAPEAEDIAPEIEAAAAAEAEAAEAEAAEAEVVVPEVEAAAAEAETAAVEGDVAPEVTAETTTEALAFPGRPIMEAPKPATLASLTSSDRDFTSTRYQSTTSPQFLNKPHQAANHSLDLDDRNMQSSVNNWYKKIFSFADSLNWRPGWDYLEEFDIFAKTIEAPLAQISLPLVQEWWAEKPKDPSINWDKIDEQAAKYEEFWEWKSKLALSAVCVNFACREVLGKTVFGLDAKMTKKLGSAMSVFSNDFGDDITATKFRHLTLKLLQESRAFQSSSRKQLVQLSQELANVLSPLTSFTTPPEPKTEEEKLQHAHYTPLTLALYEKVLLATQTLHDTIQKDHKYFALFHPVPGVEFDELTMEESTFDGLGAGKGAVALVARPGLARLGLPKGGEPEDIVIVHKALVVRDDALEDATRYFDGPSESQPVGEDLPPVPVE